MSIFIDTANLKEIEHAMTLGWVFGVTTNPLILSRENQSAADQLRAIRDVSHGPVFYQLMTDDAESMVREAEAAAEILEDRLVLKLSPTTAGFTFAAGHPEYRTCPTAIFSAAQALVAQECGAAFIAVYVNRATRLLGDGQALVKEIAQTLLDQPPVILAASLKTPAEAVAAIRSGADSLTLPANVLAAMMEQKHSAAAVVEFQEKGIGLN